MHPEHFMSRATKANKTQLQFEDQNAAGIESLSDY